MKSPDIFDLDIYNKKSELGSQEQPHNDFDAIKRKHKDGNDKYVTFKMRRDVYGKAKTVAKYEGVAFPGKVIHCILDKYFGEYFKKHNLPMD